MGILILNAIGLLCGVMVNDTALYMVFGLSFLTYFMRYSKIVWEIVYDRFVNGTIETDAKMMNALSVVFLMICGYWFLCEKIGTWAAVVVLGQGLIFLLLDIRNGEKSEKLLIVFAMELIIGILLNV